MEQKMPTRKEAIALLDWAAKRNPTTGWIEHSKVAARVAETIAKACGMDAERAYVLGLLHDIGRYEGRTGFRHVIAGYLLLKEKGYEEAARIALTHSFFTELMPDDEYYLAQMPNEEDKDILRNFAQRIRSGTFKMNEYDRLMQLADCMALERGPVTLNDRYVDLAIRYNFPDLRKKIIEIYKIKDYFDEKAGKNIYELFKKELTESMMLAPDGYLSLKEQEKKKG